MVVDKTESLGQLAEEFELYSLGGGERHDQPSSTSHDKHQRAADSDRLCLTCQF